MKNITIELTGARGKLNYVITTKGRAPCVRLSDWLALFAADLLFVVSAVGGRIVLVVAVCSTFCCCQFQRFSCCQQLLFLMRH